MDKDNRGEYEKMKGLPRIACLEPFGLFQVSTEIEAQPSPNETKRPPNCDGIQGGKVVYEEMDDVIHFLEASSW